MPYALDGIDAHIIATTAGHDDIAADVLGIEGAVLPETQRFRQLFRVFLSAAGVLTTTSLGFTSPLRFTAGRVAGLPLSEDGYLVLNLDFDLSGMLVDRAVDLVEDVVEMVVNKVLDLSGG